MLYIHVMYITIVTKRRLGEPERGTIHLLFIPPNVLKFKNIMNLSPCTFTKFCKFVNEIMVKI